MDFLESATPAPIGRTKNSDIYACLDALEVGETWEIPEADNTIRSTNVVRWWYQCKRPGRLIRVHSTSRGFMFVRVE